MNKAAFFNAVRGIFGGRLSQGQVQGIEFLLNYRDKHYPNVTDNQMAYILASAYWETAHTMQPVTEYGSQAYLRGKRYWPYIGRGYCQLTHRQNYEHYGLAAHPEKALEPETAAHVLFDGMLTGVFGAKLGTYVSGSKCDFVGARRCVNVQDRAREIAAIAKKFQSALAVAAKTPAEAPHAAPEAPTILDEIGDFFDWTKHPEKTAPVPTQAPARGSIGLAAACVLAIVGALQNISGAQWDVALSTPNHEGLQEIGFAVLIAVANIWLPHWVTALIPRPRSHA